MTCIFFRLGREKIGWRGRIAAPSADFFAVVGVGRDGCRRPCRRRARDLAFVDLLAVADQPLLLLLQRLVGRLQGRFGLGQSAPRCPARPGSPCAWPSPACPPACSRLISCSYVCFLGQAGQLGLQAVHLGGILAFGLQELQPAAVQVALARVAQLEQRLDAAFLVLLQFQAGLGGQDLVVDVVDQPLDLLDLQFVRARSCSSRNISSSSSASFTFSSDFGLGAFRSASAGYRTWPGPESGWRGPVRCPGSRRSSRSW